MNLYNTAPLTPSDVRDRQNGFLRAQGYTFVNHGRKNVCLGLLKFTAPDPLKARLRGFLKGFGQTTTSAWSLATSFQTYLDQRERDPEKAAAFKASMLAVPVTALGFSATGLSLFQTSEKPVNSPWSDGFLKRYTREKLQNGYDAVLVI